MCPDDLRNAIALAMLRDDRRRFDAWTGQEAKEWIDMIVGAVYEEDCIHKCGDCGEPLQIVRPGKYQCANPRCKDKAELR